MTELHVLQSTSVPKAVQKEIEKMILSGAFEAGQKLGEVDLAGRLGVSRGPVREAFRGLEEAGLIRVSKNRGVFVREISPVEAAELYEVRAGLDAS
ncbi:MAG: GntR family transcriptional regulator, partial [Burkholderiaceae bacterium]|nr:GntR family transcriptional regulator [Burkholderiaceae bacterium]